MFLAILFWPLSRVTQLQLFNIIKKFNNKIRVALFYLSQILLVNKPSFGQ